MKTNFKSKKNHHIIFSSVGLIPTTEKPEAFWLDQHTPITLGN
jgi:hypothetical protein